MAVGITSDAMFVFPWQFAQNGDTTAIPGDVQTSGAVSWEEGYGSDYEKEVGPDDPTAKDIDRRSFNYIINALTQAIQHYQYWGFPSWQSSFTYGLGAWVRFAQNGNVSIYESVIDGNTHSPAEGTNYWLPVDASGFHGLFYDNSAGNVQFSGLGTATNKLSANVNTANPYNETAGWKCDSSNCFMVFMSQNPNVSGGFQISSKVIYGGTTLMSAGNGAQGAAALETYPFLGGAPLPCVFGGHTYIPGMGTPFGTTDGNIYDSCFTWPIKQII